MFITIFVKELLLIFRDRAEIDKIESEKQYKKLIEPRAGFLERFTSLTKLYPGSSGTK